jgi:inositol-phosphate phosphatase/L-galactose 1-phosphate phosphatase/histidinol-phosphatase
MTSVQLKEQTPIETAYALAQMASATALSYFRKRLDIEKKCDESPVTVADLQIEREVRAMLGACFPEHEVLGEEYGAGDLTKENVWVIDPIDGTRSFISGHPLFGFLLAYLKAGKSQIGMVSMPALGELFVGILGQGASLNGEKIRVSGQTQLSEAILSINEGEKLFAFEPQIHARLVQAGHTRRFGYDCYPHALLAAGHIDGVVDYDLKPFDFLPLVGLIEAAGGIISDWQGRPLTFQSDGKVVSAATPELHRALLDLIASERTLKPI